jgi:hypothetical protein
VVSFYQTLIVRHERMLLVDSRPAKPSSNAIKPWRKNIVANKKGKSKTPKQSKTPSYVVPGQNAGKTEKAVEEKKVLDAAPAVLTLADVAGSRDTLTDGQCDNIASDCVRKITGSGREYSRSDQLQQYGVNSDQQCRAIVSLIIGDKEIGVGRYQFKIVDTSKISGIAPSWTMGQLANTIQSSAIPI